jgi:hypothetical protein
MCRSSLEIRLIVWIERKMMARLLLEIMLHHVTSLIAGFGRAVSPQKSDVSKNRFHLRCNWTFASMDQAGGLDRTHNFTRYAEITADPSLFVTLNTIIEESWVLTQPNSGYTFAHGRIGGEQLPGKSAVSASMYFFNHNTIEM